MSENQVSSREKRMQAIRRITFTACFTAFAVVIKCFTRVALTIPGIGVQVGIGVIFTFFPAILFGPLYGGIAAGLTDLLSTVIAPTGAYIPWLTVTAFCNGYMKGLLWKWMKKGLSKGAIAVCLAVLLILGGLGIAVHLSLAADGLTSGLLVVQETLPAREVIDAAELSPLTSAVNSLAQYSTEKNFAKNFASYANLASVGLCVFALAGLVFFAVCALLHKVGKKTGEGTPYLRIFITVLLTGFIVTAVNTYILQIFIPAYAGRALLILWIPRAVTELVAGIFQAYIISLLYGLLFRGRLGNTLRRFL